MNAGMTSIANDTISVTIVSTVNIGSGYWKPPIATNIMSIRMPHKMFIHRTQRAISAEAATTISFFKVTGRFIRAG